MQSFCSRTVFIEHCDFSIKQFSYWQVFSLAFVLSCAKLNSFLFDLMWRCVPVLQDERA